MCGASAHADGSGPQLPSYYERDMALLDGVAYGWAVAAGDSGTIALNAQDSLVQWDSGAGPRALRVR
jgi:hypothetical protein